MTTATVETPAIVLTPRTQKVIDAVRPLFGNFAKDFGVLAARRSDLAPKFMQAFGVYYAETQDTFVNFVRLLDPTVPAERDAYRAHKVYQAADYLRRLVSARVGSAEGGGDPSTMPVPTIESMARMLAAVLPLVQPTAVPSLWAAIESELRWTPRQVAKLQRLTDSAAPLVHLTGIRGQVSRTLKIAA
jgi:hypothetical protein